MVFRKGVSNNQGRTNWAAKLTEADVQEIRRMRRGLTRLRKASHYRSIASIAEKFGVSRSTVSQIVRGKTWRHLP